MYKKISPSYVKIVRGSQAIGESQRISSCLNLRGLTETFCKFGKASCVRKYASIDGYDDQKSQYNCSARLIPVNQICLPRIRQPAMGVSAEPAAIECPV